ncbi:MAG: transposase, partial [Candidatus Poribacteria bacterium]|nr:transposase [Candidatus Poribacteria bacterium]
MDNCQVGVYLAYANAHQTSLVDYRLYLPESWIVDTKRRTKCGVPKERKFQTKAQLGLEMIRSFSATGLPFGWVSMDCHYGEQPWLLKALSDEGIRYMADVPCDTRIFAERPETEVPKRKGNRGRYPTRERRVDGEPLPVEGRHFAQRLSDSC